MHRQTAFDGGAHRRAFRQCRLPVHRHGRNLVQGEFRAAILAQHPHGIGPALLAVVHHPGPAALAGAGLLQRAHLLGGRFGLPSETVIGAVLRAGDQRHDVVQKRALGLDDPVDFVEVLVVDARNQHRVDLHQHAALDQHLQAFLLLGDENFRRLAAPNAAMVPENPGINPRADVGVHTVDRDGDVTDAVFDQLLHLFRQRQPVGGHAQGQVGRFFRQFAERREHSFGIGQRIAGSGHTHHCQVRNCRAHRQRLLRRLFGGQQLRHHAGTRFVGAVVFAVAVVALDVAGRRDRQVQAGEVTVGLFGIARVKRWRSTGGCRLAGRFHVRSPGSVKSGKPNHDLQPATSGRQQFPSNRRARLKVSANSLSKLNFY